MYVLDCEQSLLWSCTERGSVGRAENGTRGVPAFWARLNKSWSYDQVLSRSLTLRPTQLIRMQAWRTLNVNGGCTKWPLMSLCYDRKCACAKSVAQHAEYKRRIHIGCLNDGVDQRQNKPLRENRVFFFRQRDSLLDGIIRLIYFV